MSYGKRVQVGDGIKDVHTVQKSTFPSAKYCLLFDLDDRNGLTPFLTDKKIDEECDRVKIKDMEIVETFAEE